MSSHPEYGVGLLPLGDPLSHLYLLTPLPSSPSTECPPNKDFIFCSESQSQRLSLEFSPSTINLSGMREGPAEAAGFQHQGGV